MPTIYSPPPVPAPIGTVMGGGGSGPSSFMGLGSTGGYVSSVTPNGGGGGGTGMLSSLGTNGSAAGGNNALLQQLLASLQKQSGQARTDQNAQYGNLLKSVAGTSGDVLGSFDNAQALLGTQGQTAHQQVADNLVSQNASTEQDAVNRGIGNTTIRAGMLRGNVNDAAKQNQSIDENVAGQKANLLTQRAGAQLQLGNLSADSILSKNIQGPETSQYLALLQQLGQNTGSTGGALGGLGAAAQGLMGMQGGGGSKTSGGAAGSPTMPSGGGAGGGGQPASGGTGTGSAAGTNAGNADKMFNDAVDKARFASGGLLTDNMKRQIAVNLGLDPKYYV